MSARALLVFSSLACSAAGFASFCSAPGFALEWADEFDGDALNVTNWSVRNATAENNSMCREARCMADNVAVRGGALVLTARREASAWANFTTGAVHSQNKAAFAARAGAPVRICVRGTLPVGPAATGYWPAFWLMPNTGACWVSGHCGRGAAWRKLGARAARRSPPVPPRPTPPSPPPLCSPTTVSSTSWR